MLAVEVLLGTPTPPDAIRLYIPGELPGQKKVFRSEVVLYVSANNPGAAAVAKDLCSGTGNAFTVTSDVSAASHFLLYLYRPTLEPPHRDASLLTCSACAMQKQSDLFTQSG